VKQCHWQHWVVALFLLQTMSALDVVDRLVYGAWVGKPGDKITQGLNLVLIATSVLLLVAGHRKQRKIWIGGILALAAIAFMFASALWSVDPATTIRRSIVYLFVVIGSIGIANTLEADEFMQILRLTCFIAAIASIGLRLVSPGNAVANEDFIGIFPQKNVLGEVMAVGALSSLHGIRAGGTPTRSWLLLVVFAGMALAAKSATSWLTVVAFCLVDGVTAMCRRGGAALLVGILLIVILVPGFAIVAINPDPVLEMIGKDPTLTGRTDLWAYVINDISLKPLLGWGYSAFWSPDSPAAMEISDVLKWYVPQAHNGLLEMLLNVGGVGTAFFLFLWARTFRLALRCLHTPEKALAISTFLCCAGIVLVGATETVLMEPLQLTTSVFFVTGLLCERALWAAGLRRCPIVPQGRAIGLSASARQTRIVRSG
jgi:exopolysaccharide production protein ExoQ